MRAQGKPARRAARAARTGPDRAARTGPDRGRAAARRAGPAGYLKAPRTTREERR